MTENLGNLGDFFDAIGQEKKKKEEEFRSVVGDIDLGEIFSGLKEEKEKIKKKKKKEEKQIEALEQFLFSEEEEKKEESPVENIEEVINEKIEEVEKLEEIEEVLDEVIEKEDEETIDHAIKVLDKITEKTEVNEESENLSELEKIKRELGYLRNIVNTQGGGGEVNLKYLDDIVGIATNASAYDGKFLKYNDSIGKFEFTTTAGGGYTLPTASGSTLGGVKIGDGLTINGSGVLSTSGGGSTGVGGTWEVDSVGINTTKNVGIGATAKEGYALYVDGNANYSGIITATTFSGSGASLNSIPNSALDNSTVSYGGVELALGSADVTPAFNLSDAINYPYSSLTGITTDIVGDTTPQLGGSLDGNSKNIFGVGIITATKLVGDGSGLTGIVASGSGVVIKDDDSAIGTAGTINFGTNLSVSALSAGIVTVTASAGTIAGISTTGTSFFNQINSTGVITATSFDGSLATTDLTGTITNAQLAGSIANAKLSNSTVSYGGVELALGASDATPAFNLSDATNYPTSSLSGTITNAQLAGSIANAKLSNSSVSYGGVSLSLGGSDGTPAFDLSDATNYPTSSLSGTITNAQLAGSIANAKLANSTVSYGGIELALGASDATPAFNLSDATGYPYTSLTGISTEIVGDTSPELGGDLSFNSKTITGTGGVNLTGVVTATSFDGSLATTDLTGTITNAQLAGSIANAKLSNSSVSYGGISLSLGGSDATPAFDLSDATNYPTSSLSGTITNAQLAGSIANSKLANDSVSFGGISLSLGGSDATPAFDLSDATNYPTSSLSGTITNAQLAGSIANSKLSNDSVSFGGIEVDLGASDATPAFDLSDATNYPTSSLSGTITNAQLAGSIANSKLSNSTVSYGGIELALGASDATPAFNLSDATAYPYTSLTGISTEILGDTTPQLGGDLDFNSKAITGTGGVNLTGVVTATSLDTATINSVANLNVASNALTIGDANDTITIAGNLRVNGTEIIINTDSLEVEDRNIGIASTASGTKLDNAALDGAGITIYGSQGDKTLTWSNSNSRMQFNTALSATSFSGSGSGLTNIPNSALTNSSVSYGGVSLSLGGSDATPAFDLSDATNYPTSSLSGTITNAQLAGSIANSKLANDSVSFGGIEVDLGASDATPAFDLSDATNYPTSSLSGTITNAQLAGSIADSKLSTISTAGKVDLAALEIDGGTDIGAALADADLFIVDDAAGGTNRKTAASRIKTYVADITLTTAAQTNITSLGTLSAVTVSGDITANGNITGDASTNISGISSVTASTFYDTAGNSISGGGFSADSQENLIAGTNAGASLTSDSDSNVLIGKDAGDSLTSGKYNVAIGLDALQAQTSDQDNVAIGRMAGFNNASDYNVFLGYRAGYGAGSNGNIAIGKFAGNALAGDDIALGNNAMGGNSGGMNIVIGRSAFSASTSNAQYNTVVGDVAGNSMALSGKYNVLLGTRAAPDAVGISSVCVVGHQVGNAGVVTSFSIPGIGLTITSVNDANTSARVLAGLTIGGTLSAGGLTYPTSDGSDGQVLTSDGAGAVQWENASGGGGGITGISTLGTSYFNSINAVGVSTFANHIILDDDVELKFGAGTDGYIKSDGTNFSIRGSGTTYLRGPEVKISANGGSGGFWERVRVRADDVWLYYGEDAVRLKTTSDGLQLNGDISIADKIVHTGDTNTAIRFPEADNITAETAGTERLRINSAGITTFAGIVNAVDLKVSAASTFTGNVSMGSSLMMGDDDTIWFGDDADSYIKSDSNNFTIRGYETITYLRGSQVKISANGGSGGYWERIKVTSDEVELFYGTDQLRFKTTSSGSQLNGDISIADKIVHTGDTNTAIRFPEADNITAETAGTERLRINSAGITTFAGIVNATGFYVSGTQVAGTTINNNANNRVITGSDTANTLEAETSLEWDGTNTLTVVHGSSYPDFRVRTSAGGGSFELFRCGNGPFRINNDDYSVTSGGDQLVVGRDSGDRGMTIASGNDSKASIFFGDDGDGDIGKIQYDHSANAMIFTTNTSERLRIDSSGDVVIGANASTTISGAGTPFQVHGSDGYTGMSIIRSASAGAQFQFAAGSSGDNVSNNDTLGHFKFFGYHTDGYDEYARITGEVDGTNGNGDAPGALVFSTTADGASSVSERLRIDSSGNIGINQDSPGDLLEIHPASNNDGLTLKDDGDTYPALTFNANRSGADNFLGNIRGMWNGTTVANILLETGSDTTNKDDGVISFRTASAGSPAERLRIEPDGKVLINCTTAVSTANSINAQFQIQGTNANTSSASLIRNTNDAASPYIVFGKTRGTSVGSNTVVNNGDCLGAIRFAGADGTDLNSYAAMIKVDVDGTPGSNDMPGRLEFSTTADGAVTPTERLRIDSTGHVIINTTSSSSNAILHINGQNNYDFTGNANQTHYPIFNDIHFTGSETITANRTKAAIRNDIEYSITSGQSSSSGDRISLYGMHSSVNATKAVYQAIGAYFYVTNESDNATATQDIRGVYGYARGYGTGSDNNFNIHGGYFLGYRGGNVEAGHCYGVYARSQQTTNGSGKGGDMTGVYAECEFDEDNVTNAYAFRAYMDRDAGTITNSYILYGSHGGDSNFTNRWGIYLSDSAKNYVAGNFECSGTLEKGGGSFRINHPLPALKDKKDLVHSFIEGPQMDLIYRGKVDLVNGTASVNIDTKAGMTEGTFVLLNRDIQCFTSNETGWTAVKGSVTGNIITIVAQDNTCTDTISWMVVGERQDDTVKSLTMTDDNGDLIVEPDRSTHYTDNYKYQAEGEKNEYNEDPNDEL